ncbi:MAG: outer membrane lipoprotein carrier protein LolA [Pseudomonadota bacterium]
MMTGIYEYFNAGRMGYKQSRVSCYGSINARGLNANPRTGAIPGYFFTALLSIFLVLPNPVPAEDQVPAVIGGIQKRYSHLPGFNVSYTREIISKSMAMLGESAKTDVANGKIHFKPPHFLKIEQETPKTEMITSDGDVLWWYLPHKKEAYRYPSNKLGEELKLLVDIFYGLRKAEESFKITLIDPAHKGEYQIRLTPTPPWPQVEHINLSVLQDSFRIKEVEIHNYIGGITRFLLGGLSEKSYEEEFFRFVVPEGVKVIAED